MQEPGRRVGETLVASREGQCKGPEAQRGAGGAVAETAQVREERASSSGPWRPSPLSEMDGGGDPRRARSRWSTGFDFHFTESLCYCVGNRRGRRGTKGPAEGSLPWSKFKMGVTEGRSGDGEKWLDSGSL